MKYLVKSMVLVGLLSVILGFFRMHSGYFSQFFLFMKVFIVSYYILLYSLHLVL